MSAANQYVQVLTDQGDTLVRLSLGQAEKLVAPETGLRIHRSHWIAKDNIADLSYENGNPRLTSRRGEKLPVSRNIADALRDFYLD